MRFSRQNELYQIDFERFYDEQHKPLRTVAKLLKVEPNLKDTTLLFSAPAICNYKDQFNKSTGRKVALTRLLRASHRFTREERRDIWQSYFASLKSTSSKKE